MSRSFDGRNPSEKVRSMKDFRDIELQVGDKVAYVTRRGSSIYVHETTIVGFKKVKDSWRDELIDAAIVDNPHKPYATRRTIILRIPNNIIKL
jgi:hypothetical protein